MVMLYSKQLKTAQNLSLQPFMDLHWVEAANWRWPVISELLVKKQNLGSLK
jgi:hypothetical protein